MKKTLKNDTDKVAKTKKECVYCGKTFSPDPKQEQTELCPSCENHIFAHCINLTQQIWEDNSIDNALPFYNGTVLTKKEKQDLKSFFNEKNKQDSAEVWGAVFKRFFPVCGAGLSKMLARKELYMIFRTNPFSEEEENMMSYYIIGTKEGHI